MVPQDVDRVVLNLINIVFYAVDEGLTLAYNIVKAHRGEIRVATNDKEGTEFIISLPV